MSTHSSSPRRMGVDEKAVHTALKVMTSSLHSRSEVIKAFQGSKRKAERKDAPLELKDLKRGLIELGQHLEDRQLQRLMDELDTDGDGSISFDEFADAVWERKISSMRRMLAAASYSNGKRDWATLFRHYDRDNDGTLTFEEFRRAVRRDAKLTAAQMPDEDLLEMFDHVDEDGGGEIDMDEFVQLMSGDDAPELDLEPASDEEDWDEHSDAASPVEAALLVYRRSLSQGSEFQPADHPPPLPAIVARTAPRHTLEWAPGLQPAGMNAWEVDSSDLSGSELEAPALSPREQQQLHDSSMMTVKSLSAKSPLEKQIDSAMKTLLDSLHTKSAAMAAFRCAKRKAERKDEDMTVLDLRRGLLNLGVHLDEDQLDMVMSHLDTDGDGSISLDEFIDAMWVHKLDSLRRMLAAASYSSGGENWARLFRQYDRDNDGILTFEEFRRAVRKDAKVTAKQMPDQALREVFDHVDEDGSGTIGMDEFSQLMTGEFSTAQVPRPNAETDQEEGEPPELPSISPDSSRATVASPPRARSTTPPPKQPTRASSNQQTQRRMTAEEKLVDEALRKLLHSLHSKGAAVQAFRGSRMKRWAARKNDPVTSQDMKRALTHLDVHLSDTELEMVMSHLDTDGDGSISLGEFIEAMWTRKLDSLRRLLAAASYSNGGEDWGKLFRHYDRDNNGTLAFEEFRRAVRRDAKISAAQMPDEELREVFDHVDEDGGGEIDMDGFVRLMTGKFNAVRSERPIDDGEAVPPPVLPANRSTRGAGSPKAKPSARRMTRSERLIDEATQKMLDALHTKAAAVQAFRGAKRKAARKDDDINLQDLRRALLNLQVHLSDTELDMVMSQFDVDGDGNISFDEFVDVVWARKLDSLRRMLAAASYSSGGEDWAKLFRHYDRDNDGTLTFEEFRRAVRRDAKVTAKQMPDEELREVFDHVDEDGGGEIDMDEFVQLMTGEFSAGASPITSLPGSNKGRRSKRKKGVSRKDEKMLDAALAAMFGALNTEEAVKRAFRADARTNETLTIHEMGRAMVNVGMALSDKQLRLVMEYLDTDGDGVISFDEFLGYAKTRKRSSVSDKLQALANSNSVQDWGLLFRHYDNGEGTIGFEQLRRAVRKDAMVAHVDITDEDLHEIFVHMDMSGAGRIQIVEFVKEMQSRIGTSPRAPRRKAKKKRKGKKKAAKLRVQPGRPPLQAPSEEARAQLFSRWDSNGNGALSLAQIDKAVVELYPDLDHKPPLMRAYMAADKDHDGLIDMSGFKKLLHYMVYFNNLWHKFEGIDEDGDRRLDEGEFVEHSALLGIKGSHAELRSEFRRVDRNCGGFVLFSEFCSWCAKRHFMTAPESDLAGVEPSAESAISMDPTDEILERLHRIAQGVPTNASSPKTETRQILERDSDSSSEDEQEDGQDEDEDDHHHRRGRGNGGTQLHKRGALHYTAAERLDAQTHQIARVLGDMIKQKSKRSLYGKRLDSPAAIFNAIDRDKSRSIDAGEFMAGLRRLGLGLTDTQLSQLAAALDVDKDGAVDFVEFVELFEGQNFVDREGSPVGPVTPSALGEGDGSSMLIRNSDSDDDESDSDLSEDDVAVAIFNRLQQSSCVLDREDTARADRSRIQQLLGELGPEEDINEPSGPTTSTSPGRGRSDSIVQFQGGRGGAITAGPALNQTRAVGKRRGSRQSRGAALPAYERLYALRNKTPVDCVDLSKHGLDESVLELRGQTEAMRAQLAEQAKLVGSVDFRAQRSIDAAEKRRQEQKERSDLVLTSESTSNTMRALAESKRQQDDHFRRLQQNDHLEWAKRKKQARLEAEAEERQNLHDAQVLAAQNARYTQQKAEEEKQAKRKALLERKQEVMDRRRLKQEEAEVARAEKALVKQQAARREFELVRSETTERTRRLAQETKELRVAEARLRERQQAEAVAASHGSTAADVATAGSLGEGAGRTSPIGAWGGEDSQDGGDFEDAMATRTIQLSPPSDKKKQGSIFDRLTSPAGYTGTHAHRFDADGKGKGLAGRDSPVKGKGNEGGAWVERGAVADMDANATLHSILRA